MAARRVIRIKLNGEPPAPQPAAAPKSRAELDLEAIKAKAAVNARQKGTSVASELARLEEHYLNQGK
jgi:hypothetical protein